MDKLVNKHHRSLKLLEKTLDEISAHKRQAEAKLNKQCRELGLDLTQLQRSYRDLDDMEGDMTQRLSSRRGSLPQIDEFNKSPRSHRRLSIAAIPVTPIQSKVKQDKDDKRNNSLGPVKRGSATEANKSVPPLELHNNPRKSNTVGSERKVASTTGAPINKQQVLPKIDKQNHEDIGSDKGNKQRSATVLFNKEDIGTISGGGKAVVGANSSNGSAVVARNSGSGNAVVMVYEEDGESEEEWRNRLLNSSRGRARRSSEPTISKQHLDALQNNVYENGTKAHGDNDKLKQTTLTNHHLDVVSEQDETEVEAKAQKEDVKMEKAALNFASGPPTPQRQGYSRQRRKSEGDILKWTQQLSRQQGSRGDKKANGYQIASANNEVWDSVRKCRYIRGYDPPEMVQPSDVNKFVFGKGK